MNYEPLVGIDFSGDASKWKVKCSRPNVWLAVGHSEASRIAIDRLVPVQQLAGDSQPFDRLSQFLNTIPFGYAALDAPFSLPYPYSANVEGLWQRVRDLPTDGRPFARGETLVQDVAPELGSRGAKKLRETERHWQESGVNVRSTLWAGPRGGAPFAAACMTLLALHKGQIWPFRSCAEQGYVLVEAFPAAQLRHWGLPHVGYNGDEQISRQVRTKIVAWMERERGLAVGLEIRHACIESADALDSVICIYAAEAVASGEPQIALSDRSQTEGHIGIHR